MLTGHMVSPLCCLHGANRCGLNRWADVISHMQREGKTWSDAVLDEEEDLELNRISIVFPVVFETCDSRGKNNRTGNCDISHKYTFSFQISLTTMSLIPHLVKCESSLDLAKMHNMNQN